MSLELWSVVDACWAKSLVKLQWVFIGGQALVDWSKRFDMPEPVHVKRRGCLHQSTIASPSDRSQDFFVVI